MVRPDEVTNFDALPKVLLDYWGSPILLPGGLRTRGPQGPDRAPPTNPGVRPLTRDLGDVFALRPYEFAPR